MANLNLVQEKVNRVAKSYPLYNSKLQECVVTVLLLTSTPLVPPRLSMHQKQWTVNAFLVAPFKFCYLFFFNSEFLFLIRETISVCLIQTASPLSLQILDFLRVRD